MATNSSAVSPTTSTTASPTSATTPTTTSTSATTPTTTPTSNDGGSSPTTSPSSGNGSSSPGNVASSTAVGATSAASTPASTQVPLTVTSEVSLTYLSTDPAGSTVVIVTQIATTVPTTTTVSTQSSASSSTPTAAIVGGVVGGVAGLLALALLLYCWKRRSNKDEFDGIFDPDRVIHHSTGGGTLPQLDLADESNNITPFNAYAPDAGQGIGQTPYNAYAPNAEQGMRQYGQPAFVPGGQGSVGTAPTNVQHQQSNSPVPPSSPSHYSDNQSYFHGSSGHSPQQSLSARPPPGAGVPPHPQQQPFSMYGAAPADWHTPRPGSSPPPSTVPSASVSSRSAKEREALGGRGPYGLGLATQHEAPEGSSIRGSVASATTPAAGPASAPAPAPTGGSAGVVVHQDAGRAPDTEEPPQEIPPSYDSIRQ